MLLPVFKCKYHVLLGINFNLRSARKYIRIFLSIDPTVFGEKTSRDRQYRGQISKSIRAIYQIHKNQSSDLF